MSDLHTIKVKPGRMLGMFEVWFDDVELKDVVGVEISLSPGQLPLVKITLLAYVDGEFVTTEMVTNEREAAKR